MAGCEYILMIPDSQQVSTPAVQPTQIAAPQLPTVIAKVQPQRSLSLSQPASFVVVDNQQSGPSRQLMFALSPEKTFNPPSVASGQQEDSEHNTSGLSILFGSISSILHYQQIDTPQPFSPPQLQPALSPVPTTTQQKQARLPSQSSQQSRPKSADEPALSRIRATQIFPKQLFSCLPPPPLKKKKKITLSKT